MELGIGIGMGVGLGIGIGNWDGGEIGNRELGLGIGIGDWELGCLEISFGRQTDRPTERLLEAPSRSLKMKLYLRKI